MPKKSKREKLRADERRSSSVVYTIPQSIQYSPANSLPESSEFGAIKRDVVKTVILAILAISVELALYWVT